MSQKEILRYRNVGRKTVVEIKVALANQASADGTAVVSLRDSPISDAMPTAQEIDMLLEKQTTLEAELRQVKEKLLDLRASIPHRPIIKPAVFARWLDLRDHNSVAREFCLTPSKVKAIVSEAYRRKLESQSLNAVDIVCYWEETRSYQQVAQEFDVPEFLVRNIVVRWKRRGYA
jgi:hypothetical protein